MINAILSLSIFLSVFSGVTFNFGPDATEMEVNVTTDGVYYRINAVVFTQEDQSLTVYFRNGGLLTGVRILNFEEPGQKTFYLSTEYTEVYLTYEHSSGYRAYATVVEPKVFVPLMMSRPAEVN